MFSLLKPFLFKIDPETAHDLAIKSLKYNFFPEDIFKVANEDILETEVFNEKIKKEEGVFSIKGNLDENMTNQLFQELFISGGLLEINNENFIIEGPIDSKVRLEYLFCVGEMFHPKYEK